MDSSSDSTKHKPFMGIEGTKAWVVVGDGAVPGATAGAIHPMQPAADGKTVILQCAGGKRSGMALDRCAKAQAAIDTHLAGGLGAWGTIRMGPGRIL